MRIMGSTSKSTAAVRSCKSAASILALAAVTATAHGQVCWVYRAGVPDFDQKRFGLGNDGKMHCVPTAWTNWMAYLQDNGYAGLMGGDGTPQDWQSSSKYNLVTARINALGERFHDEMQGYSEAAVHVLAQPGGVAWNVFDAALLDLARGFPDFAEAERAGACKSAPDVPALAQLIGCDADVLVATLAAVRAGQSDPLGRVFQRPLVAPYHAVKVTGALFHTQGGLDIDAHCRVLDVNGVAFPNLLAAGGAARGVSGNAVWGYLSGNGLLSAVGGGWIAAATACDMLAR